MYTKLASTILGFAGLLHLVRVLLGWELVLGGWLVPARLSLVAVVLVWFTVRGLLTGK